VRYKKLLEDKKAANFHRVASSIEICQKEEFKYPNYRFFVLVSVSKEGGRYDINFQ
jgi:hypothetical protein